MFLLHNLLFNEKCQFAISSVVTVTWPTLTLRDFSLICTVLGFSHMHGHHDAPSHSMSSSMRSPAFASPTHSSTGPGSAASFAGQLPSLSPANVYAAPSPGKMLNGNPRDSFFLSDVTS